MITTCQLIPAGRGRPGRISAACAAALAALCVLASALQVRSEPPTPPADGVARHTLGDAVTVKEQFNELVRKMLAAAETLAQTEPQAAAALREAVNEAQRAFIADDMDKVIELLSAGRTSLALTTENEIVADLRKMLETLLHGRMEMDERLARTRQWQASLAKIEELKEKQRELERTSNLAKLAGEMDKQLADLGRRLEQIVSEQQNLTDQTGKLSDGEQSIAAIAALRDELRKAIEEQERINRLAADDVSIQAATVAAKRQEKLAPSTAELAEKIKRAASDDKVAKALSDAKADAAALDKAADKTASAAREMKQSASLLGESDVAQAAIPMEQALHDLKAAEQILSALVDKAAAATPAGKLGQAQRDLAEKTSALGQDIAKAAAEAGLKSGAADTAKAAGHMAKAAGKLGDQSPAAALAEQQKALQELKDKARELADLQRRVKEKSSQPPDKQAAEQGQLADQAGKTAEQMSPSQQDGSPSQPGASSVASASKSMSQAASQLSKGDPSAANKDQNDAIDQLEKARRDLADAIEREQELAQAEALARIEDMLQKILKSQQSITAGTSELDAKRKIEGQFGRIEELKVAELSNGEGRLSDEAKKVMDLLAKEGTTAVFPEVLKEVAADLQSARKMLADKDTGGITQALQGQIERSLQEMIDALRKESRRRRDNAASGGGSGGGCCGGKQPLVPPVAELKMLRTLQAQINGRTGVLAQQAAEGKLPKADLESQHKALSDRQLKLEGLTRVLAQKLRISPQEGS